MNTTFLARTGAILFVLWGLLHVVGGGAILLALGDGAASGFAVYQSSTGTYPPLAGAVLGYLAFTFVWIGAAVTVVGVRLNWRNSAAGLALNTVIAGLTDIGLVVFLVFPGYVTWPEASIGIALLLAAAFVSGIACRATIVPAAAATF
jgi:hypothetical protein